MIDMGRQRIFVALEGADRIDPDFLASVARVTPQTAKSELRRLGWRSNRGAYERPKA